MRSGVASPPLLLALAAVLSGTNACGKPPPKTAQAGEGVPANSLSEARLHPADERPLPTGASDANADPTKPYTTKVGEAPDPAGGDAGTAKPSGNGGKETARGKGLVSKIECDRVMDKYLDLEIAKNPQLKDVSPELIEQAKEIARQEHGDTPCSATRAQYTCAMAATSPAAWQRCMK